MARNKSEKIPHPELHADVHRYYNARFGTSGEEPQVVWRAISSGSMALIDAGWGRTRHHKLVDFYQEQRRAKRK